MYRNAFSRQEWWSLNGVVRQTSLHGSISCSFALEKHNYFVINRNNIKFLLHNISTYFPNRVDS